MDLKTQLKTVSKNHQASIQNLETKFGRLADKQSGRPSGSLPSNTQPKPKGHNSKTYQPPQARSKHVNAVFTRSGKTYNPPVNPNDQQDESKTPINFDSDDEDDEPTPQPKIQNPKPVKETLLPKPYKPKISYPQLLRKEKIEAQHGKFLDMIRVVRINVPFIDVLAGMPNYEKFLKELISNKHKIKLIYAAFLTFSCNALADLGASINLMPYSLYAKLSLETLKPTKMSVRLADRSFQYLVGIAENMLVEVDKFTFPIDFVILEMEEDSKVSLILGRPFLHIVDAVIRVKQKQLNLRVETERVIFNIDSAMKHSYSNDDTCFNINFIDEILEEDFDALLDEGSKILHSIEGTCLKKEILTEFDKFMAMITDENSESESDAEEPPFKKITINTDYKIKTSLEEPPTDLELKPLPDNLEYVFLEEPSFLSVIISSQLSKEKKNKLISVLKKHKQAFAWKTTNIPGICPSFCKHKIQPLDDKKPVVQKERRLNPNMQEVVKKEIVELLDTGIVYPISDSPWVSPIHCVPKKEEGTMLRHKVSSAGLEVDKAKIDVISKLPPPANIKEIKDRKGTENDVIDHLSQIKNDELNDDSEVDDNFLKETLMEINTKDEPDCSCSKGNVEDKILVPKPLKNYARCARCGPPVDGPYCQGCTFLRKKLEEDLVTHFQGFQNTSESSDDSTNVVNIPLEPFNHGSFVDKIICGLNKAPDSSHLDTFLPNQFHCFHCKDALRDGEACKRCTYKRCGSGLSKGLCLICGNNQNSSNDSPSIFANSLQNPPHIDERCYECGDALDGIFCQQCTCKSCGKGDHIGYNCPPKVLIISNPEPCNQTINNEPPQTFPSFDSTCYSKKENSSPCVSKPNSVEESPNIFNPRPQPPMYSCEFCGSNAQYGHYCTPQVSLIYLEPGYSQDFNSSQNFHDFQQQYICCDQCGGPHETFQCWNRPAFYNNGDDDDVDYTIAITPVLSTEKPDNSLSMGDEHLDTIPVMKSDEVIKPSVEDLVPISSEFEGIPDTMCDVHLVNNPTPLEAKDHFEIVINSNDDYSSSDEESLYENIEYVEASPHDSELVSLEVEKIVIPEDEEIEDDNLHEKLLKVNLLIAKIEALKDNPTPSSEFLTKSSSTSPKPFLEGTDTFHNSLPEFENFCFSLEEISSGSTTTQSDISLPEYDSFIFDLSNDQFSPTNMSDFNHKEFGDEPAHIISPPEYDCFYFRNLPDPGEWISSLNLEIRENLSSTTCVNLPVEDDYSPLLAYVRAQYCRGNHGSHPLILLERLLHKTYGFGMRSLVFLGEQQRQRYTSIVFVQRSQTRQGVNDTKRIRYKQAHEATKEDVEQAFDGLKKVGYNKKISQFRLKIKDMMYTCIILLNMIIKTKGRQSLSTFIWRSNIMMVISYERM
nr:reverse transcriptase domain-containing protein [Tanacetum cinerariifolium]